MSATYRIDPDAGVVYSVAYGMARMFQILTSACPHELEIFRDLDHARRWLGVATDSAAPAGHPPDSRT